MKKNILLLLMIALFSTLTQAQKKDLQHSIGLNSLYIIKNVNSNILSPYFLQYEVAKEDIAFRFGLGGFYDNFLAKETGFANSETESNYRMDARAGLVFKKKLDENDKWNCWIGVDIFYSLINNAQIDDSGFDKVTLSEKTNAFGAGPTVEISYQLLENLSLSTDFSIYFRSSQVRKEEKFENFPNFNDIDISEITTDIWLLSPINLYLTIAF